MTTPAAVYPSIANQILRAGVTGVVAMGYSVCEETIVRFVGRFYKALIEGEELARAVSLARDDARNEPLRSSAIGKIPFRDWIVPVVFQVAPFRPFAPRRDDAQFHSNPLLGEETAPYVLDGGRGAPLHGFIGRGDTILKLQRAFYNSNVALLEGMAGVGKTETAAAFAVLGRGNWCCRGTRVLVRLRTLRASRSGLRPRRPCPSICDPIPVPTGVALARRGRTSRMPAVAMLRRIPFLPDPGTTSSWCCRLPRWDLREIHRS